jgi:CRISPR-associated protein Cas2
MWVFTLFDLPVKTKSDRYEYARFKKFLEKQGFDMMQYSVYIRHCPSVEAAEAYIKKIGAHLPKKGSVTTFMLTDKQFERIKHYYCRDEIAGPETKQQLQLF